MIAKLVPILGITFIDIIGFSMLLPMMPYFVTHFGVSPIFVGGIMATFSLCQLIAAPIWGNVSDRIGRKAVLIVSQVGATIGWAMLAFAPTIAWVFVARIVEGVSGGNISITQAYVADLVEAKDRSRAFGLIGAMFGCGMIFGPVIGGVLFARFGFAVPFLTAAGLQLITLLLTILLLPESRTAPDDEERVGLSDILNAFGRPKIASKLWQKLAISLGLYGWFAVIALFLQHQLGFSLPQTDFYFSAFAVVNVFFSGYVVGKIAERIGDRRMSNVGLACLVASFAAVPFVHDVAALSIMMLVFAFGMSLTNAGITALISNAATDREQGTVLGTGSSLDSLSGTVAPPVSTGLLAQYGSRFAGAESLLFAGVALGVGLLAARREGRPPSEATAVGLASVIETANVIDG